MKRVLVLGTVIVVGGLSAVVNSEQQLSQAALDATVIEHVRDNLYVITGSSPLDRSAFSGGNTGVYIGTARSGRWKQPLPRRSARPRWRRARPPAGRR